MQYKITLTLDSAAVQFLASVIAAQPWEKADPFMQSIMQQVREQDGATKTPKKAGSPEGDGAELAPRPRRGRPPKAAAENAGQNLAPAPQAASA